MIFASSSPWPNKPSSPACGLMPHTAIRGVGDAGHRPACRGRARSCARPGRARSADRVDDADVGRDVNHAQLRRHSIIDTSRRGQVREHLGVAGVLVAAGVQRFLVQRRGADRVDLIGLRELHGAGDVPISSVTGDGRQLAERQVVGDQVEVDAVDGPRLRTMPGAPSSTIGTGTSPPAIARAHAAARDGLARRRAVAAERHAHSLVPALRHRLRLFYAR